MGYFYMEVRVRRLERFTFLLTAEERREIDRLARKAQRTRSDLIRLMVHTWGAALDHQSKKEGTDADTAEQAIP